ncbi:helix-turn-helix domain-containing protein [Sanguibacter sp. 25GB23B1]|uniref:winged helix-turn-helix transcriptional regulator n=1 Tax=unclassified Sanguibacter TaxID=2645534 RepID=UPI0032AFEAC6
MAARNYGQHCGMVTALELVGERWALLIVRDLLVGARRYTDLKTGLPRVPSNILSTRLKELQEAGVIRRVPLARCGIVYELTALGRGLEDVVLALGRWGFQSMGDPAEGDVVTPDSMTTAFRTAFRPEVAAQHPTTRYAVRIGEIDLVLDVSGAALTVTQGRPSADDDRRTDLALTTGPGLRTIISGETSPGTALRDGTVEVVSGDAALLERFATTFHLDPGPGRGPAVDRDPDAPSTAQGLLAQTGATGR